MPSESEDMLIQAVERNSAAVLALPSAGMFRYHKTRFLRGVDERIWLESVPDERTLIESLIRSAEPVVVSFKCGQGKASFSSPILELDGQYRFFDATEPVQAIVMIRADKAKAVQRRSNYRVALRAEDGFRVQLWRISDVADVRDQPTDLCEISATMYDIGVGGIGVVFQEKPLLIPNQRMRLLLSWSNRPPIVLEGRSGTVRHEKAANTYKTGIQFQHLQDTLQGRQLLTELTRTVSALQLEEAKRLRRHAK